MKLFLSLFLFFGMAFAQDPDFISRPREIPLEESVRALVHGNTTFAYHLYSQLKNKPGNLFFSPYSVSAAFAIPYIGVRAGSQNQMQSTMHYIPREENLDRAFADLNRRLTKSWMQGPNEIRLFLANGLFVQRNLKLDPNFSSRVTRNFGAAIRQVDFMRNPDSARLSINEWTREWTQGRIPNLVERGDVGTDTRLVIASSVFMKAVWQNPFDSSLTSYGPFFIDATTTLSVPMMHQTKRLNILQHPRFALLELPYSKNPLSDTQFDMLIILPAVVDGIAQVENLVISGDLNEWRRNMSREQVILTMPRFKFTTEVDLVDSLKKMGMPAVFTDLADFSGIVPDGGLFINNAFHKAFISMDEKGTEAISATAISINVTSVQQEKPPVVFNANHPFLFIIIEKTTNSILFMGRFSVPTT